MKRLPLPDMNAVDVYATCVSGVTAAALAARFTSQAANFQSSAQLYVERARTAALHEFAACKWGHPEQLVLADLTKGNFTDLYSDQMVTRTQPGRQYYDRLLLTAPQGKCPFCGFGQVSTLDHFIPKSRYPLFSVLPANLVPSCSDCNSGKGADVLTNGNQFPHPYFEDPRIETEVWLYAKIAETTPATAAFLVSPPAHWSDDFQGRVINYFRDLNLAARFAVEAASELISLSDILREFGSSEQVSKYLKQVAKIERQNRRNSWKAALFEALSESDWYSDRVALRPP